SACFLGVWDKTLAQHFVERCASGENGLSALNLVQRNESLTQGLHDQFGAIRSLIHPGSRATRRNGQYFQPREQVDLGGTRSNRFRQRLVGARSARGERETAGAEISVSVFGNPGFENGIRWESEQVG